MTSQELTEQRYEQERGADDGCRVDLSRGRCSQTPTVRVLTGCVHEHVTEQFVCAPHLRQGLARAIRCGQCQRFDGHFCPKSFMEMP